MNTWVGEKAHLYTANYTQLDNQHMNDNQFHTWRFDWHTDELDRRVDVYVDDKLFAANRDHYAGRLWIGAWSPNNWAGEANFDTSQMEIDYVKFYECPPESYPHYGWAPGTNFSGELTLDNSQEAPGRYSSPTPPLPSSPTNGPTLPPSPAPVSAPTGNTAAHDALYNELGCNNAVTSSYCENTNSGSYCKDWSSDECGRSICQGRSFSDLAPCPIASDEDLYKANGCANLSYYCTTYCKDCQQDHCGRAVCHGDSHLNLDPC